MPNRPQCYREAELVSIDEMAIYYLVQTHLAFCYSTARGHYCIAQGTVDQNVKSTLFGS